MFVHYPRSTATKSRLSALLLLVSILSAAPTGAAVRFAELQVDASKMADFFWAAVAYQVQMLCPMPVPDALCGGTTCFVDHIDAGDVGSFRHAADPVTATIPGLAPLPTTGIQFVQPVRVYFKSAACILDPGCPKTSYHADLALDLVLDVNVQEGQVCALASGFELNGDPVEQAEVPGGAGGCAPIDTEALAGVLGPGFQLLGLGIALDADVQTFALRFELGLPAEPPDPIQRLVSWQHFLDGEFAPASSLGDWRLVLNAPLLASSATRRFSEAMDGSKELELDGPVHGWWVPWAAPGGRLGADFSVDVEIDECPNSIGADVTATLDVGYSSSSFDLTLDGVVSWDVVDSDVALCGLAYLGVGIPVAAVIASNFKPDPADLGLPSTCVVVPPPACVPGFEEDCPPHNQIEFDCTAPVLPPAIQTSGASLTLAVDGVHSVPAGMVLHGTAAALTPFEMDADAATASGSFWFGVQGDCPAPYLGYGGRLEVSRAPVCNVEIGDGADPYGVYDIGGLDVDANNAITDVELIFPTVSSQLCEDPDQPGSFSQCPPGQAPLDAFWNLQPEPYPLRATLWTTRGAWTVEVDPPQWVDPQTIATMEIALLPTLEIECLQLGADAGETERVDRLFWAIDPAERLGWQSEIAARGRAPETGLPGFPSMPVFEDRFSLGGTPSPDGGLSLASGLSVDGLSAVYTSAVDTEFVQRVGQ